MKTKLTDCIHYILLDCHIYGLATVVLAGMWAGGSFFSLPSFDLELFCAKSSEIQATDMHLVPPVALLLATSDLARRYPVPSLQRIVVAAAPLKVPLPYSTHPTITPALIVLDCLCYVYG